MSPLIYHTRHWVQQALWIALLFGMALITPAAVASLNDGLVAYYPFNGDANDESGNGHNGTVYGTTLTEDRFGNGMQAYYFNGTDNYIELGVKSRKIINSFIK